MKRKGKSLDRRNSTEYMQHWSAMGLFVVEPVKINFSSDPNQTKGKCLPSSLLFFSNEEEKKYYGMLRYLPKTNYIYSKFIISITHLEHCTE